MAGTAESSMIFSLVVPLAFMIFMSVSIDRVWGMYNSLQLLSNYISYEALMIPPASYKLLMVLKNISNFNIMKNETVQIFLRTHVFTRATAISDFVLSLDTLSLLTASLVSALALILVLQKVLSN